MRGSPDIRGSRVSASIHSNPVPGGTPSGEDVSSPDGVARSVLAGRRVLAVGGDEADAVALVLETAETCQARE